jgi:hypothetical protein
MLIALNLKMENGDTNHLSVVRKIPEIIDILVSSAFPELGDSKIHFTLGRVSSFAQIQWDRTRDEISINVNQEVKKWHEAALIGLISHELSHPVQKGRRLSERETDKESISRGLGPYLATERLFAGKYEDHRIQRGRDKYLGYRSIRAELTQIETQQLDLLIKEIGLVPTKSESRKLMNHDIAVYRKGDNTTLLIGGQRFSISQRMNNPDVKLLERNGIVYVYANEVLVGEYKRDISPDT